MSNTSNQKLVAYISSEKRLPIIQEALKYIDCSIQEEQTGKSESIAIRPILNKLSMMVIDVIIIDLLAISDEDEFIDSLRNYKAKKEDTQVLILLAEIHKKGTDLPSQIVNITGYYDLIAYDDDENEKNNLINYLQKKNSFANAMKWQKVYDEPATSSAGAGQIKNSNLTQTVYKHVYNNKIMFANLTKCAGSSFLTLNLAKLIASNGIDVNVVEAPIDIPYLYSALNFDEKLRKSSNENDYLSSFVSYPHELLQIKPGSFIDLNAENNKDGNITYYITSPHLPDISKEWTDQNMVHLLNLATASTITIVDVGKNLFDERYRHILPHMDKIYVILEPMVTPCLNEAKILKMIDEMKNKGYNIEYIYNKVAYTPDLPKFQRFTGDKSTKLSEIIKNLTKITLKVPYLSPKSVQSAHNNGEYALDQSEINFDLYNALYAVAKQFVPKQLFQKVSKKIDYIEDGKETFKAIKDKARDIFDNL